MTLQIDEFDIAIVEHDKRRRWFGPPGWYWAEYRLPPRGPSGSVGDALRDLTAEIASGALPAAGAAAN